MHKHKNKRYKIDDTKKNFSPATYRKKKEKHKNGGEGKIKRGEGGKELAVYKIGKTGGGPCRRSRADGKKGMRIGTDTDWCVTVV